MGQATVRNISDSYVRQSTPTKNYGTAARLYVGTGFYSYLFFSNPIPLKAKVTEAKLVFFSAGPWSGSVEVFARLLGGKWSANKVNWNNDPNVAGPAGASQVKSGAGKGTRWEIDISTHMQAVSNGQKFYGFRITATGAAVKSIFSAQAAASRRPYVILKWSDAPMKPADLVPRNLQIVGTTTPVLSWDFVDYSGNRNQSKYRLQIDNDNTFATPLYDSETLDPGGVINSVPEHPTFQSWAGTPGTTYYWRVKTWDGAGLESPWSDTEDFRIAALPTATITSPSSGNPYVVESTPLVGWSMTGGTQEAYRVMLYDNEKNKVLWDSGRVDSTNNFATIPKGLITKQGGYEYRLKVYLWDSLDRVATAGVPVWCQAERVFTYQYGTGVPAVSSINVTLDALGMAANVQVTRSTAPDYFNLVRNGVVVDSNINPVDVQNPSTPTEYNIPDFAPGRQSNTWAVVCVVNGVSSAANPTDTETIKRKFSWLCDPDGGRPVGLTDGSVSSENGESSEVMQAQSGPPVLVTQNLYGEFGSVSAIIRTLDAEVGVSPTLTARTQKNNLNEIRDDWGGKAKLMFQDEAWDVFIHHIKVQRIGRHNGTTEYAVEFEFFEV